MISSGSKPGSSTPSNNRPALHLDRLVRIVGEDEHRRVVWRLLSPPSSPITIPGASDGAEHVAAHDIRTAAPHELPLGANVSFVKRLVQVPVVEFETADAQRVLAALIRACDESVERY
jgi:hypothetical protein